VVASGAAHTHQVSGILGLLCREHFPGLVEYAGVTGPAYSFDHYVAAPDAEGRDSKAFNNKAEPVRAELWVSLPHSIWLNISHSLDCLQIINEYIMFVRRISTDASRGTRPGRRRLLPDAARSSSWTCTTRHASRPSSRTTGPSWERGSPRVRQDSCR